MDSETAGTSLSKEIQTSADLLQQLNTATSEAASLFFDISDVNEDVIRHWMERWGLMLFIKAIHFYRYRVAHMSGNWRTNRTIERAYSTFISQIIRSFRADRLGQDEEFFIPDPATVSTLRTNVAKTVRWMDSEQAKNSPLAELIKNYKL